MEESLDRKKKDWLVRSSMKILGPFDFEDVIAALEKQSISIIDEIRNSETNWCYIREHRLFSEIVYKLRSQSESHLDSTVAGTTTSGMTKTVRLGLTKTDLTPVMMDDDATPLPAFERRGSQVIQDVTPISESTSLPKNPQSHKSISSYGSSSDQRLEKALQERKRWLSIGAVVFVAVVIAGALVFKGYQQADKRAKHEDMQNQARLLASQGFHQQALDLFRAAIAIAPLERQAELDMAFLLVQEDLPVEASRIFNEQLKASGLNKDETSILNNGLGLAAFSEGDFLKASSLFDKALAFNPSNIEARLNSYIVRFHRNETKNLYLEVEEFYRRNPSSREAALLLSLISHRDGSTADIQRVQVLYRYLAPLASKSIFMRQQLALQMLSLAKILQDSTKMQQSFDLIFSSVPLAQDKFAFSSHIDRRYFTFLSQADLCHELSRSIPAGMSKPLLGLCLVEENKFLDAAKIVDELLFENPRSAAGLALKGIVLHKTGKLAAAQMILQSDDLKNAMLGLYVAVEICIEKNDVQCAYEYSQKIYSYSGNDMMGLYGLAWSFAKQKQNKQAQEYLNLVLSSHPNFIPALELQKQIEGF